ncbi:MAG: 3-oxoacyl-[acyl-carrier-protein] synthase III C-terminal domain-containing protein [Ginsengibacter sp.]
MRDRKNMVIESLGIYLPEESFSTAEILGGCKKPIRFPLEKISGIKSRCMAGTTEFSIDLAKKAIADCLQKSKYTAADIDILICCNISRYDGPETLSFEPCTSIKLKKYFGFEHAIAFDISNACAGMFTGVYIVNSLINSGAVRRGLVVSGEYITHLTKTAQIEIESFMDPRLACLTLGDAGAALILEKGLNGQAGFQEIQLQTLGRYSAYCIGKASETGGWTMYTDSVNLTDVAIKSGARNALDVLQSAGWPPDKFQHLIMHQTSTMTLNSAKQEINNLLNSKICNEGNTINNLELRGNTASTSHFIALWDHIHNNRIQSGDKIVFIVAASGLTVGTALYVVDDLPLRLRNKGSERKNPETFTDYPVAGNQVMGTGIRIESVGTLPECYAGKKTSVELLHSSATNCLEKSIYTCNDIELLIHSGVYRSEYIMEPAIAALLAGKLEMNGALSADHNNKTLAFDIFNGAIGFLNACYIAQQMIHTGNCRTAMIVASEIDNNANLFPDKLLGVCETASAIILDAHPNKACGFSRILFNYQLGSLSDYTSRCVTIDTKICLLVEKAPDIEDKYIEAIMPVVKNLLQQEGLELCHIDLIFPPQISSGFIKRLSEKFDLSMEKFANAVEDRSDIFSSSIAYGIEYALKKELVKPGDTGLIIAIGSGIQVGCALYKF